MVPYQEGGGLLVLLVGNFEITIALARALSGGTIARAKALSSQGGDEARTRTRCFERWRGAFAIGLKAPPAQGEEDAPIRLFGGLQGAGRRHS